MDNGHPPGPPAVYELNPILIRRRAFKQTWDPQRAWENHRMVLRMQAHQWQPGIKINSTY